MGAVPKLRDLTWEPPKTRPAPYLQKLPDRRAWTATQGGVGRPLSAAAEVGGTSRRSGRRSGRRKGAERKHCTLHPKLTQSDHPEFTPVPQVLVVKPEQFMSAVSDQAIQKLQEVALHRRRHLPLRLLSTGVIIAFFFPVAGVLVTLMWATTYTGAQLLELFAANRLRSAVGASRTRAYYASIVSMLTSVACFAVIAVMWSASSDLGAAYAVYLLAGSIMHTVSFAHLNRSAFLILNAPVALALAAQPLLVGISHRSWWDALCMTVAVALMITCTVKVWRGLRESWFLELALRDELQAALAKAEGASEAKSAFLATMSHEIRTPLNGVLGMSQALEATETCPDRREQLRIIRESGHALRAILNDVLDMSKIEAGMLCIEHIDLDLGHIMNDVAATFTSSAAQRDLTLTVRTADVGCYRGDPVRIRQVLSNLISNAIKFTHEGTIEVAAAEDAGRVVIEVSDTGIGIDPSATAMLFSKFVQADASTTRRYGGTGLGLAITSDLVELMGGTISVRSVAGQGSTFRIELPLASSSGLVGGTPKRGSEAPDVGALRVLAAEDNPANRMVLQALLAGVQIDLVMVTNGQEAVEAWEREPWDLILMDVQMPVLDGPTAAAKIRAAELITGRERTPILAVTANALDHQIAQYRASGMDDHVTKPILVGDLFAAIDRAMTPVANNEAPPAAQRAA